jgi:hypothetical protein
MSARSCDDPGPDCNLCHDTGDVRNRYGEFTGRCSCTSARETAELIELARSGADVPSLELGGPGRRIAAGVESCPAHPAAMRRLSLFRRHYAVARIYASPPAAAWIALRFSAADGRARWDMDGVFQTKAIGALLLTGLACCIAALLGVNALPALVATAALFCLVAT